MTGQPESVPHSILRTYFPSAWHTVPELTITGKLNNNNNKIQFGNFLKILKFSKNQNFQIFQKIFSKFCHF